MFRSAVSEMARQSRTWVLTGAMGTKAATNQAATKQAATKQAATKHGASKRAATKQEPKARLNEIRRLLLAL